MGLSSCSSVITAATSSAQSCSEKCSETMPRPCQRWSKTTTRKCFASSWTAGNQVSIPVHPTACSSTIVGAPGGPSSSVSQVRPRRGSSSQRPSGISTWGTLASSRTELRR